MAENSFLSIGRSAGFLLLFELISNRHDLASITFNMSMLAERLYQVERKSIIDGD
jgi:hypothetical protein